MPYVNSLHTAISKPLGLNGQPTDARSYFYDTALYVYRCYVSTTEVLNYLATSANRKGNFCVYVNSTGTLDSHGVITGGTVLEYWFKDGIADGNLIQKSPFDQTLNTTDNVKFADILQDNTISGTYRNQQNGQNKVIINPSGLYINSYTNARTTISFDHNNGGLSPFAFIGSTGSVTGSGSSTDMNILTSSTTNINLSTNTTTRVIVDGTTGNLNVLYGFNVTGTSQFTGNATFINSITSPSFNMKYDSNGRGGFDIISNTGTTTYWTLTNNNTLGGGTVEDGELNLYGYSAHGFTIWTNSTARLGVGSTGDITLPSLVSNTTPNSVYYDTSTKKISYGPSVVIPTGTDGQIVSYFDGGIPVAIGRLNMSSAYAISTPTSGSGITMENNKLNVINPSSTIASLTISFPSSPADGDAIEIKITQTITSVIYSGGTIINPPTSNVIGFFKYMYNNSTSTWY